MNSNENPEIEIENENENLEIEDNEEIGTTLDELLQDEIIQYIFSFFRNTELRKVVFVCKRWSELALDPFLWDKLYISKPTEKKMKPIITDFLKSIYLCNCGSKEVNCLTLLHKCRNLRTISFEVVPYTWINEISNLLQACPIESLSFVDFSCNVRSESFLKNCSNLTNFSVSRPTYNAYQDEPFQFRFLSNIERLELVKVRLSDSDVQQLENLENFKKITYLNLNSSLKNQNLNGILLNMPNITFLDISGCHLSLQIQWELLPKLIELNLSNGLDSQQSLLSDNFFENMKNLAKLDVSLSKYSFKLRNLVELPQLRCFLSIESNSNYSSIDRGDSIILPPHCAKVDLRNYTFMKEFKPDLPDSLQSLFLFSCGLKTFSVSSVSPYLSYIDISKNQLSTLPQDFGKNCPNLLELNCAYNSISLIPDSFGQMKRLRKLSFEKNKISSIPDSFQYCTSLNELSFRANSIINVPLFFNKLTHLNSLDLSFNQITKLSDEIFDPLELLTELSLEGNKNLKKLPKRLTKKRKQEKITINFFQIPPPEETNNNYYYSQEKKNCLIL
ncbi:hypothetical protein M0811_09925 [Anaeramoeba ignava]|uniref:F-box domain-containing protein n=1 Tax=Anaeramoeba ignava TaxID=1746090 RepID=A0A9Q0LIE4_ANAIG|nr:hypothetical protein M0811_09925 [Anaeramoeba ignava]